ncbi:hypothetical protein CAPTEDRAFT_32514, partial [Capitella teleta]
LFRQHWHHVITYCCVFADFGMCVAFLGPTVLDLGCLTSTDMQTMSLVFFSQLLCSLIGASMAGYLHHALSRSRCHANHILLVATSVIPMTVFLVPFCRTLWVLAIVLAVMGINMGTIDCLANLQMINLFGEKVPPFLQAMHFCYGLGAFISPMIVEPFLLNEDCTIFINNATSPGGEQISATGELIIPNNASDAFMPAHSLADAQLQTRVQYAFWIIAAVMLPVPLLVLSLSIRLRITGWKPGHHTLIESDSESSYSGASTNEYGGDEISNPWKQEDKAPKQLAFSHLVAVTALISFMLFLYDGLQSGYGAWVYSYAVKSIVDLNTTEGAYLNALFWGMFALGRLISIPLATRFSPVFMLLCNIVSILVNAMIIMVCLRHDHVALYVGTALFGIFLSSIAPTTISVGEAYIDLTSAITSIIVVMGAIGEMVFPVIIGNV